MDRGHHLITTTNNNNFEMKMKRFVCWFIPLSVIVIIWKLNVIENGISDLQRLKDALEIHKDELQLSQQQLLLLEQLQLNQNNKDTNSRTVIYAITPTYWRYVQKAELTRLTQTLQLVPNVHWIVVEDAEQKTDLVRNLLAATPQLVATHLNAKTPPFEKLKDRDPRWKKHRGVEQRNVALKWLRDHLNPTTDRGIVYFMDDDNTYSVQVFKEMTKVRRVGVWPVGLVGGLNAESPIVDPQTGKVTGYVSGWKADRPFAIDMAGFAINLNLILTKPDALFSYRMEKGLQESEFLGYFTTKDELEPLADNCTKVYVWHTRTEKPIVNGVVPGLEV